MVLTGDSSSLCVATQKQKADALLSTPLSSDVLEISMDACWSHSLIIDLLQNDDRTQRCSLWVSMTILVE